MDHLESLRRCSVPCNVDARQACLDLSGKILEHLLKAQHLACICRMFCVMKPFDKKEKSDCSASDDSPPQRPKRNTCQKTLGVTNGLLWREETDLKRALYASLQENKKKNWDDDDDGEEHIEEKDNQLPEETMENGEESPKKAKVHAQRKFAQGSTPNSPVLTPQKIPSVNNSSTQLLPYKRPKTEDFLTFLCLRGTSILPPSLDFLNSCSKSDTSSDCRSLSPELEEYSGKDTNSKHIDAREKSSIKHDGVENGLSRKIGACKASSKRYLETSSSVKKNVVSSKINKEAGTVKKRKIRDENEDPSKSKTSNSKAKSTGLNALREKYKKQRLAADKKKLIPSKSSNNSGSKKVNVIQKSDASGKPLVLSPKNVSQKKPLKTNAPVLQKSKQSKLQKKLAVEKRKSLRSADVRPKRLVSLRKKTPWIRRAKLVPPIVDVESDSSEPEIIHTTPVKKVPVSTTLKKVTKLGNVCDRLRSKQLTPKVKSRLTARQMLLRKHMQNRLKSKKPILHSKDVKSRTIVKRTAKESILKKAKKNLVMKTMSLRKDLQNKRVTRSAKHQIEEMFWSNPEKKSKAQNQKPFTKVEKKKLSPESNNSVSKKQKSTKGKEPVNTTKNSKDGLKRKSGSSPLNDSRNIKQRATSKTAEIYTNPAKMSKLSLSKEEKPGPSGLRSSNHSEKSSLEDNLSNSEVKPSTQNDLKKSDLKSNDPKKNDLKLNESKKSDLKLNESKKNDLKLSESKKNDSKLNDSKKNDLKLNDTKKPDSKIVLNNVEKQVKISASPSQPTSSFTIKHTKDTECTKFDEQKNSTLDFSMKVDHSGSSDSTEVKNERSVQNNLNLSLPEKASNKDISSLMELNVNIEEAMSVSDDPCCSSANLVIKDKTLNKARDSKSEIIKEVNLDEDKINSKKQHDKKSLKQSNAREESKSSKKNSGKEKFSKKDKYDMKSPKKHSSKERRSSKDSDVSSDSKKSSHKKDNSRFKIENKVNSSETKQNKSDHKKSNKTEKSSQSNDQDVKNSDKSHKKDKEKSTVQNSDSSAIVHKKDPYCSVDINKASDDVFLVENNNASLSADNEKKDCNIQQPSLSKDHSRNNVNSSSSSTNRETDDDSDYDLTLDQFIKMQALRNAQKSHITVANSSKEENSLKASVKESKDFKVTNKDADKKAKKDGESSKHKKDKESSKSKSHDRDQKTPKKEDKLSKKDPKALAKLLKKEKLKSKKEEKSKHKKDGSSSSKSKKDGDKDGSKSTKKEPEDSSVLSNLCDSNVEPSEGKKDKTKKESKLSRSSSCDETKSPKKKKKHSEFKDIEKIKNLISKSSILSEFSGFKEFKRRSSSDKSELKKSKKKKKLALLKDKKLSKKLSAKLLRKYSKKKGLKSKKKLKKKELKEMKIADLESKILSKSKKQKHKLKGEHHGKDNGDKSKNIEASVSLTTYKSLNITSSHDTAQFIAKVTESFTASTSNPLSNVISNSQTSSTVTSTVPTYIIESIPDVIPPMETISSTISQPIAASTEQYVFSSPDELQGIVTSDFTGVFEETFPTGAILLATRDTISQVPLHFIQDIPAPKTMADAATNTGEDDIEENVEISESLKSDEMSVGTQTMTPVGSPLPTVEIQPLVLSQTVEPLEDEMTEATCLVPSVTPVKTVPTLLTDATAIVPSSTAAPFTTSSSTTPLSTITPSTTPLKLPSLEVPPKPYSTTPVKSAPPEIPMKTTSSETPVKTTSSETPIKTTSSETPIKTTSCESPIKTTSSDIGKIGTSDIPLKTAALVTPQKTPVSITPTKTASAVNSVKSTLPSVTPSKSSTLNSSSDIASTSPKPKRRSSFVKKSKTQSIMLPEGQPFPLDTARMVAAPVYHPTAEEFRDPLEYIFKIQDEAAQFGICKIVPPSSFKPECKVNDDMRFTAHNQYLHKMLNRWGPNVQHTACIKKHLKSQKVKLDQAPLIGGMELDISRFYHTVQQYGGLQQVIEKKKWQRVADALHVPKTKSSAAQDRVTKLYDAYCKYLVSYDTLPKDEKQKLEKEVIADHERRVKLRNSPKDLEKDEEDFDDEENTDCVSKGRSMSLSNFFRIARNIMSMWYKNVPSPEEVEHEYWKVVTESQQHVVVHAGNIDSSVYQSGFACSRNSPFAKHPWNLKILTNNSSSILRCMGPVSGVTIPTLHVGMLFTTGCWYRDPHSLPWIEYLHTGASKIWYSIPAKGCEKFRESMKKIMPEYCTNNPIWLPSDTAMVPPELLVKHGASLSRTIQNSGQFVVIFPESFTSTICCGYCVSESVYFAPTSWLDLAVKAFKDIQSSCEPPSFSLERLLFSIATDPKTQPETLQKILPLLQNIRLKDMHLRAQLAELGLKQWERLPVLDVKDRKKKSRIDEEFEQECEICRTHCYVSMVVNVLEDTIYCLPHALEHIPKKNLKLCKLKYTYDEKELKDLEGKVTENITVHLAKLSKKKSPKKKLAAASEN